MIYSIFGIELSMIEYATLFFVFQLINVALSTMKTIIMYKKNKLSSANINAISYGFYAIIVIMTASDLPLWLTVFITLVTNWIGVYFSMMILEGISGSNKKDKLWEVVATIPYDTLVVEEVANKLIENDISFNVTNTYNNKEHTFYIYSKNQDESRYIKREVLDKLVDVKYIVHEEQVKLS